MRCTWAVDYQNKLAPPDLTLTAYGEIAGKLLHKALNHKSVDCTVLPTCAASNFRQEQEISFWQTSGIFPTGYGIAQEALCPIVRTNV